MDSVLVFNDAMKEALKSKYDISDEKFIMFEMLDYTVPLPEYAEKVPGHPFNIGYAGSFDASQVNEFSRVFSDSDELMLHLFGQADKSLSGLESGSVKYHGKFSTSDIVNELAINCDFGLIMRGEKNDAWQKYHEFTSTSKFCAYMVSGIPIIVPERYGYLSRLVNKYDVGIQFNALNDLPGILGSISEERYREMIKNARDLGAKISQGFFLQDALIRALQVQARS